MKRREMLRAGFRDLAQALPLALVATGSLGRLLTAGAGLLRPPTAASFPGGNGRISGKSEVYKEEEE